MFRHSRKSAYWMVVLTIVVLLSYWKIVFTKQFSILWQWEMVSQYYAWATYAATWVQNGIVPLWDPFRFGGNSFIGEMQTGLFYPFKLALYLAPFDQNGLLSERAFNLFYVFSHWLAAVLMFGLVRHLKLGNIPALIAGICFGLGGSVQRTAWMNILDAMPWLPLTVLFVLRAFESRRTYMQWTNACAAGLALGMTWLAGSLHIFLMDAIAVATLVGYLWLAKGEDRSVFSAVKVLVAVALIAILFGAVQLLPSLEYARLAYRWVGGDAPIQSFQRISYSLLAPYAFGPQSIFAFVLGDVDAGKSDWTPYFGVLPLLLGIIGAWRYWALPLVRYLTALAAMALVYSWASLSLLHGVMYLVPYLDMAREADRFIYLTHFGMAVLAGFGAQSLFEDRKPGEAVLPHALLSVLKWVVIGFAALLTAASLQFPISISEKTYLSFFFLAAAYGLLLSVQRARRAEGLKWLVVFVIAWDLYSFDGMIQHKSDMQKANTDALAQLVYDRKLADFIKAQPGMPRVHFDVENSPNIGNAYGVPLTWAMSATMLVDYSAGFGSRPQHDLLGVRYLVRRKDTPFAGTPVYGDEFWNVYENPSALPRAWVVHRVELDVSGDHPPQRLLDSSFDPRHTAIIDQPLETAFEDDLSETAGSVRWLTYEPNRLELEVDTGADGMLVLGEVFYPGWSADVAGSPAKIYRANGFLRAIPVTKGVHRVSVRYEPASVRWGALLTLMTFIAVCCAQLSATLRLRRRRLTRLPFRQM
jgi:hypothetical protein